MINIEVIYALPEQSYAQTLQVNEGCTIQDAITQSGILQQVHLELPPYAVGIWGRRAQLEDLVKDGDRIEIYRELLDDPKEIRRRRGVMKRK
ncbi:RnfH family protein [Zophobihabitans entericus]|uniref:UPF0125 protein IPMB12_04405 n=1 Tax=Zophobihabitans entericus TaxID=1635327 RepID=A0A6G9I9U1_9GAMM|nr:RnfH family protein [Zophobihabitans entericus]QIQ20986.1 RnfH family protein [Zophobihabitans entericus]